MNAAIKVFGAAVALLLSLPGEARPERFVQIVGASSPDGDAHLVKHFRVSSGAIITGVVFYSNDLRTEFPRVALLRGPASKVSEAEIVAELRNISSIGAHRIESVCQPIVVQSTADYYVAIQLPVSDGVRGVGDGAGIGARQLEGPANSYFVSGPDAFFGAMDVDYAIELLDASAGKADRTESQMPPVQGFLRTISPVGSSNTLEFGVERISEVTLTIYDVVGRRVRTLTQGTFTPGVYTSQWNGLDENGRRSAAGIYLVKLTMGGQVLTKKLLVTQ